MTAYTPETRAKFAEYLNSHHIPAGIGTEESACSIAAINLALTGKLTDIIPDCMSLVIGRATIVLQDAMPDEMRNSARYKAWLVTAPGTGRDREQERLAVLMDWVWSTALPQVQSLADEKGFGAEWRAMCEEQTAEAANAARIAALVAEADDAAYAAFAAARAYAVRADAIYAYAADAVARAAAAAATNAKAEFWQAVDPISVLERMTNLEAAK